MRSLSEVLRNIREAIGLTQDQLSDEAGVSMSLVYKIERQADYAAKRSTSLKLYRALREASTKKRIPIDDAMWHRFEQLAGIPASFVTPANLAALEQLKREADATRDMPADVRRCHDLMMDLIQTAGASPVLKLLEGAAAFLATKPGEGDEGEERQINVRHSPVQRDGYVEQRVTTYAQVKPKGATGRKRTGG